MSMRADRLADELATTAFHVKHDRRAPHGLVATAQPSASLALRAGSLAGSKIIR
jgi:hypothetical protein